MKDYVIYGDTDSLFYSIETFIETHVGLDTWNTLDDDQKINICNQIAGLVTEYVNNKAYKNVQVEDFNSHRKDFKIIFEQEIIAKAGLFVGKKYYGLGIIDKAGTRVDNELLVKGLAIVKSDTPRAIKPRLKNIMNMIIYGEPDKNISKTIRKDKKELLEVTPDEIARNTGVNGLDKYIRGGKALKGTPGHVHAAHNYNRLLRELGLENMYETIKGFGEKIKVVYVLPNKYDMENVGFLHWPKEFETAGIKVNYSKMIDQFYTKMIETLLSPAGKAELLGGGNINSFFV